MSTSDARLLHRARSLAIPPPGAGLRPENALAYGEDPLDKTRSVRDASCAVSTFLRSALMVFVRSHRRITRASTSAYDGPFGITPCVSAAIVCRALVGDVFTFLATCHSASV